ncbi:MAG: hypothetical protein KC619_00180 [Myxococcales bacterium]|nr:hypothetical protein [Myxococcales bacterium]
MRRYLALLALAVPLSACAPDHAGYWIAERGVYECDACQRYDILRFDRDAFTLAEGVLRCEGTPRSGWVQWIDSHVYRLSGTSILVGRDYENAGSLVLNDDGTMRTSGISTGFDGLFRRMEGEELDAARDLLEFRCHPYWGEECGGIDELGDLPCASGADCPVTGYCDPDYPFCDYPYCR